MSSNISLILTALRRIVAPSGLESALAQRVKKTLLDAGLAALSEQQLTDGRVDIRVGQVAIELKVQGSAEKVLAQLRRYSEDPTVTEVVLVTTSAKHRVMPSSLGGKPLHVVYLPRL